LREEIQSLYSDVGRPQNTAHRTLHC